MAEEAFEEKNPTERRNGARIAGVICGILLLIAGTIFILYENVYRSYAPNLSVSIITIFYAVLLNLCLLLPLEIKKNRDT